MVWLPPLKVHGCGWRFEDEIGQQKISFYDCNFSDHWTINHSCGLQDKDGPKDAKMVYEAKALTPPYSGIYLLNIQIIHSLKARAASLNLVDDLLF